MRGAIAMELTVKQGFLLHASYGLCPAVRHYGDQFTREGVKQYLVTFGRSLKTSYGEDHSFTSLIQIFLRTTTMTDVV